MAQTQVHTVVMTLEVEAREELTAAEVADALWRVLERNPDAGADLGIRVLNWVAPESTHETGGGDE